jgi:hypothetical protein
MRTTGVLILILLSACAAMQPQVAPTADQAPMPEHHESTRTLAEIQEVFDRNKGPLIAIYNRSARGNGDLGRGIIVFSFGIAPDGSVTHCEMVSSTFNYPELEKPLLHRITMINFGERGAAVRDGALSDRVLASLTGNCNTTFRGLRRRLRSCGPNPLYGLTVGGCVEFTI